MPDIKPDEFTALEWIALGGDNAVIDGSKLPALKREELVELTHDGWAPTALGLRIIAEGFETD